ncbi:MAG: phosphatase PAP2 family protein [Flavipsychrobacter sp.]
MEKTISFAARCILVLLLALSYDVHAQNTDIDLLRNINGTRGSNTDAVMNGITQSTYPLAFATPATQLIVGYIRHDKQTIQNGWQTVSSLGTTVVLAYGLKYAINRSRPYETYKDIVPYHYDTDPSFPSGHTSIAFANATSLSLQYPKWYVIAPAYLWAGAIGYSRLQLGMHYPSDVLAGAIIGAGSAFIAYKGQQWLLKRKQKKIKGIVE